MKRRFWIPWLFSILGVFGTLFISAGAKYVIHFIDVASLAFTLGLTVLILLTHFSPKEFGKAFKCAMEGNECDKNEIKNGILFFDTAKNLLIITGILGGLMGCISILFNVVDSEHIAYGAATAMLCLYYSLITIFVVCIPFISALKKRLNEKI